MSDSKKNITGLSDLEVVESAKKYGTIFFSAGKIGYQVEMNPLDLEKIIRLHYSDIIVNA